MQSKRDQVQAHMFAMGRLTAGMLMAEPDAPETPLGRTTRGTVIGVVIALLISAGVAVYGLISPRGTDAWRSSGKLIINSDTGARYFYLDGRLRPVRNYASSLLIGGADLATTNVHTASLRGTPVGAPVGIKGAPDAVPDAKDLDSGPWQVCTSTGAPTSPVTGTSTNPVTGTLKSPVTGTPGSRAAGTPKSGAAGTLKSGASDTGTEAYTTLIVGASVEGTWTKTSEGIVVKGPDQAEYLVWQGSRLQLDKASGAALSMGYGSVDPQPVSAAFLDALAVGPVLKSPAVTGLGAPGPSLEGHQSRLGQVFQVQVPGARAQYYQLQREGLVPLTDTEAALALGDPATRRKAYDGTAPFAATLGVQALKEHQASGARGHRTSTPGMPTTPPRAMSLPADQAVCARALSGKDSTQVSSLLVSKASLQTAATADPEEASPACLPVDAVVVRPGSGALVRALAAAGTTVGDATFLVADNGVKYRITSLAALQNLGYTQGEVKSLPSPLLSMLPSGPDLDPEAASRGQNAAPLSAGCNAGASAGGTADVNGPPTITVAPPDNPADN